MGFEPMIGVLQDPTQATFGTLARLWRDSVGGSADSRLPGGPKHLTVFWGQATDMTWGIGSPERLVPFMRQAKPLPLFLTPQ
jgi:hypothetical protein